jgi:hypothetical protein
MKNLKKLALILLLINLSQMARADEVFKSFTENRFDSIYNVNYFKTESNFGADGSQQSLPSGYSFQITDIKIQARYVLIEDWGLYGGLSIGNSEANDALATRKNSSLNYFHLGTDFLFYQSHLMSYYADLSYYHAVEKIATDTDSALNSDGAGEIHANIVSLFDFDYVQPFFSLGINYRLEGLSTLLTYSAGLQTSFSDFVLGGALNGYVSVIDDKNTSKPLQRELILNRVNATSKKFGSINPNNLDADLFMKIIFNENFSLFANGGYSVIGSNSALGYHFGAGLTWGFGSPNKSNSQMAPAKPQAHPKNSNQPIKKFQEDTTDGVNQDYFKTVTPAQDNYINRVESSKETPEEASDFKVTPKKTPPAADNEYKIKLKKKMKKVPPVKTN